MKMIGSYGLVAAGIVAVFGFSACVVSTTDNPDPGGATGLPIPTGGKGGSGGTGGTTSGGSTTGGTAGSALAGGVAGMGGIVAGGTTMGGAAGASGGTAGMSSGGSTGTPVLIDCELNSATACVDCRNCLSGMCQAAYLECEKGATCSKQMKCAINALKDDKSVFLDDAASTCADGGIVDAGVSNVFSLCNTTNTCELTCNFSVN